MGIFDWKHWIVILVVVVLVFGTKKLKNLGTDEKPLVGGAKPSVYAEEMQIAAKLMDWQIIAYMR